MNIQDIPDDDTGQAIKRWAEEGTDLTRPIEIDFFIDVADDAMGAKVSSDSALAGFSVSVERDGETGRWTCYCTKTMIPEYPVIVSIEKMLTEMGRRHGARYGGFGSFGNAEI